MAEFLGALAWAVTGAAAITGVAALAAGHLDKPPRLSPRPRYRRTPQR